MIPRACRLLIGAVLAWSVASVAADPDLSRVCAGAAIAIFAAALWRPWMALALVAALAPAGLLLAPAPARAAELVSWAFLAGWLLRVWRPLTGSGWPLAVLIPALAYTASAAASWLSMTIGGAAGVRPLLLPLFLFHAFRPDHLLFSTPEPETWTLLQTLAGMGLFLAALGLTRDEPRTARGIAYALVASMAALSVATLIAVVDNWSRHEYAIGFLRQYISSERVSRHLTDVNAAGSQYVLAGAAALGLATFDRPRRWMWIGLLAVMLPAAWLTGSRSAGLVAAVIGALTMAAAGPGRHWTPTRAQIAAVATTAVLVLVASGLVMARDANVKESAGRAMRLRTQFVQTSARMFASAPVFGVGIGRYHGRSGEFMPDELRALYGFENAHNYFAQQFAELGLVGGASFVWLIVAAVRVGWRRVRGKDRPDGVTTGLFAGAVAYLLTCVTGHPLLVSEAAFPFWLAIGAMAGNSLDNIHDPDVPGSPREGSITAALRRGTLAAAILIALALAANVGRGTLAYVRTTSRPNPQGFYPTEAAADGTPFQWTTRHAVTYLDPGLGFLTLTMRAPDAPQHEPVIVETQIEGRTVDRRELPPGTWVTSEIPVRQPTTAAFRRVDLRVNQMWTRKRLAGTRLVDDLLGVMVSDIRWTPVAR